MRLPIVEPALFCVTASVLINPRAGSGGLISGESFERTLGGKGGLEPGDIESDRGGPELGGLLLRLAYPELAPELKLGGGAICRFGRSPEAILESKKPRSGSGGVVTSRMKTPMIRPGLARTTSV